MAAKLGIAREEFSSPRFPGPAAATRPCPLHVFVASGRNARGGGFLLCSSRGNDENGQGEGEDEGGISSSHSFRGGVFLIRQTIKAERATYFFEEEKHAALQPCAKKKKKRIGSGICSLLNQITRGPIWGQRTIGKSRQSFSIYFFKKKNFLCSRASVLLSRFLSSFFSAHPSHSTPFFNTHAHAHTRTHEMKKSKQRTPAISPQFLWRGKERFGSVRGGMAFAIQNMMGFMKIPIGYVAWKISRCWVMIFYRKRGGGGWKGC